VSFFEKPFVRRANRFCVIRSVRVLAFNVAGRAPECAILAFANRWESGSDRAIGNRQHKAFRRLYCRVDVFKALLVPEKIIGLFQSLPGGFSAHDGTVEQESHRPFMQGGVLQTCREYPEIAGPKRGVFARLVE
jgi:hypothetical protein